MRTVRFTEKDAQAAWETWDFNCGPAALCAVTNMTPEELRPHMGDFESKGYTNPSMMDKTLRRLGREFRQVYRSDDPAGRCDLEFGLVRIQWGGSWTNPGVPMMVRYRKTHWIALAGDEVFDVNAMNIGGWLPGQKWETQLVPWLLRECCPKGDGTWWPTHGIEVVGPVRVLEESALKPWEK